jgi:hypothetical protein
MLQCAACECPQPSPDRPSSSLQHPLFVLIQVGLHVGRHCRVSAAHRVSCTSCWQLSARERASTRSHDHVASVSHCTVCPCAVEQHEPRRDGTRARAATHARRAWTRVFYLVAAQRDYTRTWCTPRLSVACSPRKCRPLSTSSAVRWHCATVGVAQLRNIGI